jgi:serine/threonine-protein kinase RsbT
MKSCHPKGPHRLSVSDRIQVQIKSDVDIVRARQLGRETAAKAGFSLTDQALIATAISELARNIVRYAKQGKITIEPIEIAGNHGITVIAHDRGPGIHDVELALQVGFSTSGSLGLGLPGVKRLVDDFHIRTKRSGGTTVTIKKWKH